MHGLKPSMEGDAAFAAVNRCTTQNQACERVSTTSGTVFFPNLFMRYRRLNCLQLWGDRPEQRWAKV